MIKMTETSNRLIKDSILLLCNVVNQLLGEHVLLASHFRHAKYDKTDDNCVSAFWKALHRLLCTRETCSGSAECVKINFARLNYRGLAFYALPSDIQSSAVGSRELLLAFSWLVANRQLERRIDELIERSGLNRLYPSSLTRHEPKRESQVNVNTLEDQYQFIFWCLGRMSLKINAIHELRSRRDSLGYKIHSEIVDNVPGDVKMTALEVYLLCNRGNDLNDYLSRLNQISELLDSYFFWLKKYKIFFKWMSSVVEERQNVRSYSASWDLSTLRDFKKSLVCVIKDAPGSIRDSHLNIWDEALATDRRELKARLQRGKGKLDNNLNKFKNSLKAMNIMVLTK